MVGQVGDRGAAVADPVAERAAPLVRDLQGQHLEPGDAGGTLACSPSKVQRPRSPRGRSGSAAATSPGAARRRPRRRPPGRAGTGAPRRRRGRSARENGRPWVWSQWRWPSSSAPRNGASPSSAPRPRSPVPASSTRLGALAVAWPARRTTCCRRGGRSRAPGPGSSRAPRARGPSRTRSCSSRRWPSLTSASLSRSSSTLRASATLHGRHRDEGGRPPPALEHGPLADQRARAEVGDVLAVHDDLDHAVEQQVDRVGLLALLGERRRPP